MKSDSELMNELAHRTNYLHAMTNQESQAIKQTLTLMYQDLQDLCIKHNLQLMLGGGSCLGAVRHKGFIPWDDDLDAMMPRQDYNRLIQLLEQGALGDNYEFSAPNPKNESVNTFLKIFLKDTKYIDLFSVNTPFPKGLYIDVFAIESTPKSSFARAFKGIISNGLEFCCILTHYAKYPSKELKEYMSLDKAMLRRYRLKRFLGHLVGVIPRRKWLWWFDLWAQTKQDNPLWTIPTGRRYYQGEIMPKTAFVPVQDGFFEGHTFKLPHDYDAYLTNLYGNYMQLPPENKRERHFICEIKLPDSQL